MKAAGSDVAGLVWAGMASLILAARFKLELSMGLVELSKWKYWGLYVAGPCVFSQLI